MDYILVKEGQITSGISQIFFVGLWSWLADKLAFHP
jgi:hypothetical protein